MKTGPPRAPYRKNYTPRVGYLSELGFFGPFGVFNINFFVLEPASDSVGAEPAFSRDLLLDRPRIDESE